MNRKDIMSSKNKKRESLVFGGINDSEPDSTKNDSEEGIISKIFNGIFMVISVFLCIMILVLFIVSVVNITKYNKLKKKHKNEVKYNQLIIKDTLDYKLLAYTEGLKSEPLLIKTLIMITNAIFTLVASYILLFCLEIAILGGLAVYAVIKGGDTSNMNIFLKVKINKIYAVIVAVSLIGAVMVRSITKTMYLENALPSLLKTKMMLYNLKQSINPILYIDKNYLEALRNNDIEKIKTLITNKISSGDVDTTARMIFTYNIYNHYQTKFTVSDITKDEIKNKFKPEILKGGNKKSLLEPAEYLIYTDDDLNLLTFNDNFTDVVMRDDAKLRENMGTTSFASVKSKVDVYLKNTNDIANKINKVTLEDNTNALIEYIYNALYTSIGALVLIVGTLIAVLYMYLKDKLFEIIGNFVSKIVGFIKIIFINPTPV